MRYLFICISPLTYHLNYQDGRSARSKSRSPATTPSSSWKRVLILCPFSLVMSMAHLFGISEHVAVNCDIQYYIRGKNYVVWLLQACRHTIILSCYFFWVLFDVSAFIFIEHSGELCIIALGDFMCITLAFDHLERTVLLDLVLYIYKAKPSSWWDV